MRLSALIVAILTVIFAEFFVIFVTGIMGGVEAGRHYRLCVDDEDLAGSDM